MKIVVCIKQVPEVTNVQVDPQTGTLIREGIKSILNPFCEYALDHAVRIARTKPDVEIIALTMGPAQAHDALIRSMELGADRGILVSDRKFAGADTWATALTLASTIRKFIPDFNLILVGKQAIDGDTAQVGPEIAEILGLPQVTYGIEVVPTLSGRHIHVKREVENGYEIVEAALPALVSVSKGEAVRRAPSLSEVLLARQKPVQLITAQQLDLPDTDLGLQGSFTQVIRVFPPQKKKECRFVQNEDVEEAASAIYAFLQERRFIA